MGDDDDADPLRSDATDHVEPRRVWSTPSAAKVRREDELAAPVDEAVELDRLTLAAGKVFYLCAQRGIRVPAEASALATTSSMPFFVEHRNAQHRGSVRGP